MIEFEFDLEPREPELLTNCRCCGMEIYEGETLYRIGGINHFVCQSCIVEYQDCSKEEFDEIYS